jgi:hypothetical protein
MIGASTAPQGSLPIYSVGDLTLELSSEAVGASAGIHKFVEIAKFDIDVRT